VVVTIFEQQVTKQQNELLERTATSMAKNLAYVQEAEALSATSPAALPGSPSAPTRPPS
jgi:hypothetical protein